MFNLFKRKKKYNVSARTKGTPSCEDSGTLYVDFPDGLRLIFQDGKYTGWYTPTLPDALN